MSTENEKLKKLKESIANDQKEVNKLVLDGKFEEAIECNEIITEKLAQAKQLKEHIQSQNIVKEDIQALREIEPKRKSVQNMLEPEVAATAKFEKLLGDELGEKSPYEMRRGNNDWLQDESRQVEIVHISTHPLPKNVEKLRDKGYALQILSGRLDENGKILTKPVQFTNKDTGVRVVCSRKSINEIVTNASHDVDRNSYVEARLSALFNIKDIIEKTICFDSQISEYDQITSKSKSGNTLFMHRMYGIMEYKSEPYLLCVSIEEYYEKESKEIDFSGTKNRLYNFKDIKITPTERGSDTSDQKSNDNGSVLAGATTISIPQLYDLVKTYDKNFFENPKAVGRAERLEEIKQQENYKNAVEIAKKAVGEKSVPKQGKAQITHAKMERVKKQVDEKSEKMPKDRNRNKNKNGMEH